MTEQTRNEPVQIVAEPETERMPADELEALFRDYHGLVFRAAVRVTGNASDAEDVLQTVFLRLVRRPAEAVELRGAESYLYRAAINSALDLVRSKPRRVSVPLEDASPAAIEARSSSPDRVLAAGEIRKWLRRAITRLSPRSAEIFILRFFEGRDNGEIARLLETTPSTVAVTLHRTRERLHREYDAEMGGSV